MIRSAGYVADDYAYLVRTPAGATRVALEKAGLAVSDIDLLEVNEAFCSVALNTIDLLGIDPERVNVNGGAVALGHPDRRLGRAPARARSCTSCAAAAAASASPRSARAPPRATRPCSRCSRRERADLRGGRRPDGLRDRPGGGRRRLRRDARRRLPGPARPRPLGHRALARRSSSRRARSTADAAEAAVGRIAPAAEPVAADLAIEAATEDVALKERIFRGLDEAAGPGAVLATNTSSIPITRLAAVDLAARAGRRHALHEPGAADAARRADPRPRHLRRGRRLRPRRRRADGQDGRRGARPPRLHLQPHPRADDQRGRLLPDGGRRRPRLDRHRHAARDEPPDGAAAARRPDRPRHLPRDHGGAPPRPRRRQVPALPAAAKLRRGGPAGPQVRAGASTTTATDAAQRAASSTRTGTRRSSTSTGSRSRATRTRRRRARPRSSS